MAVALQGVGGALVRAAEDRADGAGAGEQGAGLVALHLQALLDADPVAVLVGDVLGLPVDEGAAGPGEAAGGAARPRRCRVPAAPRWPGRTGRRRPGWPGRGRAPSRRCRGAALLVAVHQVVVQQREVVDQLDGDRAGHAGLRGGAGDLGGQHGEGGAHGLAAVAVRGPNPGRRSSRSGRRRPCPWEAPGGRQPPAVPAWPGGPAALQERGHVHRGPSSGLRGRGHSGHSLSSCCGTGVRGPAAPLCRSIRPPPRGRRGGAGGAGRGRPARRPPRRRRCGPHSPWSRATRWRSTLRPGRGRVPWCGRRA